MKYEVTYTYYDYDIDTLVTVTETLTAEEIESLRKYMNPEMEEEIHKVTAL